MISAYKLLCCPLCKSAVTEELKCLTCGEKYTLIDDVYVIINPKLSGKEWKWNESIFSQEREKLHQQYRSFINEETRKAQKVWQGDMKEYIDTFHGYVIDIATGLGEMFENLLKSKATFLPIAMDVNPNVLVWTKKKMEEKYSKEFIAVASELAKTLVPLGKMFLITLHPLFRFNKYTAQYRIRVGDYRVLYDIDDNKKIVWILTIRKRGEKTYK
ncbi:unnamed protein product [marine sediment metagenome]|uniref:Uncharacterized protein n=2 Tax=marine sediment metagenome TaxID=412755 RepID=X1AK22_9ZZZZ